MGTAYEGKNTRTSSKTHEDISYLRSWNLLIKLDMNFSTSASSSELGADLIIGMAPARCRDARTSSITNEIVYVNRKQKRRLVLAALHGTTTYLSTL